MSATLSFDELDKHSENVYEAIVIIAKRARQINEEQKRYIETETGLDDSISDSDDEEEFEQDRDEIKIIKLPKPTQLAIEEYLQGKLKYEYTGDEAVS
ncbi:MAG: DNA-directed RNA polymerase subunit omega [bacterium]|nr:DNA-directed RNA polymerase subunit omega [bacterium]